MLLITGGLIAVAVLALVAAFLVARGGAKPAKSAQPAQTVQVKSEPPTPPRRITSALEVEEQTTEKRPAITAAQLQRLAAHRQAAEKPEQLDFPEHPIPTYINIDRDATVSDFNPHTGATLPEERWSASSPSTERDVAILKRQLYELAGQLHLMQHKSRAIEQRVLEISGVLERLDNENASKSAISDSASQISY